MLSLVKKVEAYIIAATHVDSFIDELLDAWHTASSRALDELLLERHHCAKVPNDLLLKSGDC